MAFLGLSLPNTHLLYPIYPWIRPSLFQSLSGRPNLAFNAFKLSDAKHSLAGNKGSIQSGSILRPSSYCINNIGKFGNSI